MGESFLKRKGYSYPPEPLDELETPNYPTEASIHYAFSEDDLRLDREERSRYGVSTRDHWNFFAHWLNLFARGVRQLRNECTDPDRYEMFDQLLEATIAVNEISESNTMALESDSEKQKEIFTAWEQEWKPKADKFPELLAKHWMEISPEAPGCWNKGEASSILHHMKETSSFTERRVRISDPITWTLDPSLHQKHHDQRANNGFSEWDLLHFRTYLTWLLAQGCAFFSSDSSHGFPGREPWDTTEKWNEFLLEFMDSILSGEAAMCMTRTQAFPLMHEDQERYKKAIASLSDFLFLMWD